MVKNNTSQSPKINVVSSSRFLEFRAQLIKALKQKDKNKAVEVLCLRENISLRQQYPSLTTLRRYYTYYRNICRECVPEAPDDHLGSCLGILNLTREEILLLNLQYSKKVSTEHRNLRALKNYDGMILKAIQMLGNVSIYDRILALAFLTGRRVAEIACTAKFKTLKQPLNLEKNWMVFDGQLKAKTKKTGAYKIPVLAEPFLILEGIKRLRLEKPQWIDHTIAFHNTGSPALSVRVKKQFSEFTDNPTVKDLRAAYAEICYEWFATPKISKSRFFSDILGHGEDDNLTGQSYIDFYLEQGPEYGLGDGLRGEAA